MDAISLVWAGGEHDFALRIGELRGVQEATDRGPEEIYNRLRFGTWKIDEIVQVLRWGLVGGGMKIDDATTVVMRIVDLHPISEFKLTAMSVLAYALLGPMDDAVGEGEGETENLPENGSSPGSTETGPS
ncbi:hypothetical protein CEW89_08410 [Celeribacter ethanolicus]|uniref:Gene transfer agent family protein n=1 Tax=Celeribacter ethanolicus TaxID=1758178 RepID=A0A291GBM3_9RHOB|nr:gene transfer agent family protein [Celeribacter ethanolicus]ATG47595.1 hypothetical protein CEW89_08410 [Celeribacter ethanolicus]